MAIPLSKLPKGLLNDQVRDKIYQGFEIGSESFLEVLQKIVKSQFGVQYEITNREFYGVCLYVLSEEEKQSLVTAGAFEKAADTSSKNLSKLKACRVFIPEIHSSAALPDDIYNPSKKDKEKIGAFFPVFISQTEDIAAKSLQVGQILQVKITNNNGGGSYVNVVTSGNSVINVYNENKPNNNLFKCEILRFSKIVNTGSSGVSSGEVLTSEKQQDGNTVDLATLKQQYKRYLSEKETYWSKTLQDYWMGSTVDGIPGTLKRTPFKYFLNKIFEDVEADTTDPSNGKRKLIWLLLYRLSAYSSTGITNAGLTVLNVDSIDDSYGIFKHTKEQFDSYRLDYDSGKRSIDVPTLENSFFGGDKEYEHADLLDPELSMRFFILDFAKYLRKNNKSFEGFLDYNRDEEQKLITNYFTKNDKKIKFLFFKDYGSIADQFDGAESGNQTTEDNKPNVKEGTSDLSAFPTFQSWLVEAAGGAAVDISEFTKVEPKKPNNSQTLDQEKPKDTKDECHDNYPQRNSYLEHVDAQKGLMRKYLSSNISGEDLEFLSHTHEGVKNIVMADQQVATPFKVVRFDGDSGYPLSNKRWINAGKNQDRLIKNKNYKKQYYRPSSLITKATVTTINLKSNPTDFYKNGLELLYDLNKPIPHFVISQTGQIIQLVDAAAMVENNLPNKKSSINIAFVEGIGTIDNIDGENNTVLDNYILVSTDPENNVYRPHRIGSKAALQSADKLIKFLTSKTNIKYNVATQDFKLDRQDINKSGIQAYGHYKGVAGMNFIYYAWTYGLAYKNGGKNILSRRYGYN